VDFVTIRMDAEACREHRVLRGDERDRGRREQAQQDQDGFRHSHLYNVTRSVPRACKAFFEKSLFRQTVNRRKRDQRHGHGIKEESAPNQRRSGGATAEFFPENQSQHDRHQRHGLR